QAVAVGDQDHGRIAMAVAAMHGAHRDRNAGWRRRAARPTSFLSCHRTSLWGPREGGLFGFKFSSRPHPWKFGVKRFLVLREVWRGSGVACFGLPPWKKLSAA